MEDIAKVEILFQEPSRLQDAIENLGVRSVHGKKLLVIGIMATSLFIWVSFWDRDTNLLPLQMEDTENMPQDYVNTAWSLLLLGSLSVLGLMMVEFLRRATLLRRELHVKRERYNGSLSEIMNATLKTKYWRQELALAITALGLVFTTFYFNPNYWPHMLLHGLFSTLMLSAVWIICNFFDIPRHLQMSPAGKMGPQDNVGAALVWSYYYGYLKLILPSLRQRAQDYKNQHKGVFMPVSKLLILMPESCFAPKRLDDNPPDRDFLEHAQNLAPVVMARAGNAKREYQTPVYKIMAADKPVYCIAEIPAFLEAMREMVKQASETTFNEDLKNIWFEQACTVMNEVIKRDETCRDSAEIIRYKDKMAGGKSCRISEILLERIGHIRSEEVKNRP